MITNYRLTLPATSVASVEATARRIGVMENDLLAFLVANAIEGDPELTREAVLAHRDALNAEEYKHGMEVVEL